MARTKTTPGWKATKTTVTESTVAHTQSPSPQLSSLSAARETLLTTKFGEWFPPKQSNAAKHKRARLKGLKSRIDAKYDLIPVPPMERKRMATKKTKSSREVMGPAETRRARKMRKRVGAVVRAEKGAMGIVNRGNGEVLVGGDGDGRRKFVVGGRVVSSPLAAHVVSTWARDGEDDGRAPVTGRREEMLKRLLLEEVRAYGGYRVVRG